LTLTEQTAICSRPFEWFEVHPDGSVFLCCPAWLKRPAGNLLRQSAEQIWNGPIAREIRKSILNGSFHNCSQSRCPHLLNRTTPICHPGHLADPVVQEAVATSRSVLAYRPRQLNLCFDHSCNLACPSCRRQQQVASGDELAQAQRISSIVQTELLPYAHTVTLSGFGDPFGSPTYLELLRKLNRQAYPQLEQVRLHTNGQMLDEQMWQSLSDLQRLVTEIEISLDAATEETYRLNRPGGNFDRLLQNLEFLSTTGCKLTLSMVIQQNNWQELPKLVTLAKRFQANIYLGQLVNWGTFSSEEYLQRAVQRAGHEQHGKLVDLLTGLSKEKQPILSNLPFLNGAQRGLQSDSWDSSAASSR